uniref:hypothetical protein n=1 Tax=Salmonella sp. s59108 TaxID=3159714 RepID=UPI0039813C42
DCPVSRKKELDQVVSLLVQDNRQAVITEFGGGNNKGCTSMLAEFAREAHKVRAVVKNFYFLLRNIKSTSQNQILIMIVISFYLSLTG